MVRGAREVLNWDTQKAAFEPDGSLRDLYVLGTTIDDWKAVLRSISSGPFDANLLRDQVQQPVPTEIESLFATTGNLLLFKIHGVELACHFFTVDEIEFDFVPNSLTEASMLHLLEFMLEIGRATGKPVIMTPENCPETPIFRYEPDADALMWNPPSRH